MAYRWIGWAALGSGLAALSLGCAQLQAQPPLFSEAAPDAGPARPGVVSPDLAQTPTMNPISAELTQAHLDFGFALLGQLRQATPEGNVLVSPTSVALALALAYNGAGGDTQAAIATALHLNGLDLEQL
ncbi:MAG TPA: serpin family protein, partial [Nodosilinea sp.]|nr:serpin family protein [Nodosilinea sp.]